MPVYNEQAAIGRVLEKWSNALDALGIDYVIRPYNDGSKDNSLGVMKSAAVRFHRIEVRDKTNGGHGHTILTGYRDAANDGFDWVFQVDSDDEMGPEKFEVLWSNRESYDFLVGTRDGRSQQLPRKVVSLVSRLCVRLFYGKSVWDVNTPYRLMRVSAFAEFYRAIPLTTFAPNVILSGIAARKHLRRFETRVPQHDRTTGEVSIRKWKLLKAAARSFEQTIAYAFSTDLPFRLFLAAAVTGLLLRLLFMRFGWNFDYDSYEIVAGIVNRGGNVYAETSRYNYGPIWFCFLGTLKNVFGTHFRIGIVLFLSAVDIGIAALLWRWRTPLAAFMVLLSPLSIHITGYHNQFDNFALLAAFVALASLDRRKTILLPSILLGISLTIKHVFVFFPFWFLFESGERMGRRILRCVIPLLVFALSFMPYIAKDMVADTRNVYNKVGEYVTSMQGKSVSTEAIIRIVRDYAQETTPTGRSAFLGWTHNVILYRSQPNGLSWRIGLGRFSMPIFVIGMIMGGFLWRRHSWLERGLCYTALLLLLTPAFANQYFAIPVAYCATHLNIFSFLYNFVCDSIYMAIYALTGNAPGIYGWVVLLLAASLLWPLLHPSRKTKQRSGVSELP